MSDDPPSDQSIAPQPLLIDRLRLHFCAMRKTDMTIRKLNREVERYRKRISDIHNLIAVSRVGIRARERGLMVKAYALLRKETGIKIFPGFRTPQEEADAYRKEINEKLKSATESAKKGIL